VYLASFKFGSYADMHYKNDKQARSDNAMHVINSTISLQLRQQSAKSSDWQWTEMKKSSSAE